MWLNVVAALSLQPILAGADPFAFFRPSVTITAGDRRALDRGDRIARVLPGASGRVGVFAAVRVEIDGDRLVAWMREIAALKKSPYVLGIGRFSDPPRLEDLDDLTLDDQDLSAIRRCRPGDCDLKLAGPEIEFLQRAVLHSAEDWKPAAQAAFRQVVLQRVQRYLAGGHAALDGYEDKDGPVSLEERFSSVLGEARFLTDGLPQFADYLGRYPHARMDTVESFVYWSKERLAGKPIVSATHVSILRSSDSTLPDALVAGKGIFATHYMNASLGITAVLRGDSGSPNYLAYFNRSDTDVVRGIFGGLVRVFLERRLKNEASEVLLGLRRRLESGDPKPDPA
jgi:hypothetical protein